MSLQRICISSLLLLAGLCPSFAAFAQSKSPLATCQPSMTPFSESEKDAFSGWFDDFNRAESRLAKAVASKPDDPFTRIVEIEVHLQDGDLAGAASRTEAWTSSNPTDPYAITAASDIRHAQGDWLEGYGLALKAVKLNPCLAFAYRNLGIYEWAAGYRLTAQKHFSIAHQLLPNDIRIWFLWLKSRRAAELKVEAIPFIKAMAFARYESRIGYAVALEEQAARADHPCRVPLGETPYRIPLVSLEEKPGAPVQGQRMATYPGWGIRVLINGRERVLNVSSDDTGISIVAASASGLALKKQDAPILSALGNNGNVLIEAGDIQIGSLTLKDCPVTILPTFGRNGNYTEMGQKSDMIEGIIGTRIFEHYLVTLDFPHRELRLDPLPGDSPSEQLNPDWLLREHNVPPELKNWTESLVAPSFTLRDQAMVTSTFTIRGQIRGKNSPPAPVLFSLSSLDSASLIDTNIVTGKTSLSVVGYVNPNDTSPWRWPRTTGKLVVETAQFTMPFDSMIADSFSRFGVTGTLAYPALKDMTIHLDYRDNLLLMEARSRH